MTEVAEVVYSPREAILHSAQFLKKTIVVRGTVVLADESMGRVDISHQGAKIILRLPSSIISMPQVDQEIVATGVLRKEQRRTFLMVSKVHVIDQS